MYLSIKETSGLNKEYYINDADDVFYLYADGTLNRWKDIKYTKEIYFASREMAQEALDKFNNKGKTMNIDKLETGMILVQKNGNTMMVLKNTKNGDIVSGNKSWKSLNDLTFVSSTSWLTYGYDIVAVYQPKNNVHFNLDKFSESSKNRSNYTLVWEYQKEPTIMTIAEIQKKLGIDNLHIKD